MESQRVRLVKCPKCLKILQEDEDVLVYQCGGCSTILQAKRRIITSSVGETKEGQASELETNNVSSIESLEKHLSGLELSHGDKTSEIQQQECSVSDSEKNQEEETTVIEAGASLRSSSVDHVEATSANSPNVSPVKEKQPQASSSSDVSEKNQEEETTVIEAGASLRSSSVDHVEAASAISLNVSPVKEKQPQASSSLQIERPGGRFRREPYKRVSPLYHEIDRYLRLRAHSLQMPPYGRGRSYESVDYMYNNNIRSRGQSLGVRFSGEIANYPSWYSGQLHSYYSPQRPMAQQQPEYNPRWSREIVSDVDDHQLNRYTSHHQHVAKRHVRPTAGGAPFVSCYRCSESLQLPIDFLIFKRKYHLLRCSSCNTVLRFSLQSKTHLVPVITQDLITTSRSSNSTSESSKPEKLSSVQNEELTVTRGSPLHRLMGYSTISQVFKASQRPPSV